MPSCNTNNSSNLSGNLNIHNITNSGARLLMTVPLSGFSGGIIGTCPDKCHGITAGNAIRYDNTVGSVSYGKYIKAQADTPANSEVVGIIEDVNVAGDPLVGDDGYATIVLAGQINLAEGALWGVGGSDGDAGGNDVYFLSAATGGVLQNLAPTEPTNVIKPIYQVAPDSPWTGQVVNYIGYQAGGQLIAEDLGRLPVGAIQSVLSGLNARVEREGWVRMGSELNLDGENGQKTYGYAYQTGELGKIAETYLRCYIKNGTVTASMVGQTFKMREDGKPKLTCQCIDVSAAKKYVDLKFQASEYANLETFVVEDNYWNTSSGALLQLDKNAKYLRFKLPTVSASTSVKNITLNINNKPVKKPLLHLCHCPSDSDIGDWGSPAGLAVSVAEDLTIKKITVNDTLAVSDDAYQVTNLVKTVEELINQVNTLTQRTGGASDTFTSAYGSVK